MNLKQAKRLRRLCKERYGEGWRAAYKWIKKKHEAAKRQEQGS